MSNQMTDADEIRLRMIGYRIRAAREIIGLSQEELAKRIGKTQRSISDYENGLRAIRITELPILASALAVDIDYFFKDPAAPEADRDDPYARMKIFFQLNFSFQFFIMDLLEYLAQFQSRASQAHPEFWDFDIGTYFQQTKRRLTPMIKQEIASIMLEESRAISGRVATFLGNVDLHIYNYPDTDWPHTVAKDEDDEPFHWPDDPAKDQDTSLSDKPPQLPKE